jgi:hypothetical protein
MKEIFLYLKDGIQGVNPDDLSEEEKEEREFCISQHLPWVPGCEKRKEKGE